MQALHIFENSWSNKLSNVILFCVPFFFIIFADSILSFIFPIVVADTLKSNGLMGIIMAASSVAGLISDFIFPQIFKRKTWKFFLIAAILCAFSFPVSIYLGQLAISAWAFLFGSIMWGIYFEFVMFSEQLFVVNEEKRINYSKDWGIMSLTWQSTAIIGPVLGSALLFIGKTNTVFTIIFFQIIALGFALIVAKSLKNKHSNFSEDIRFKSKINILTELKSWNILIRRVWPAITVGIIITCLQASFWTIGGIFGAQIFGGSGLDWLIVSLFFLPMVVGSLLITKFKPKTGKKRISQTALIVGSLLMTLLYFADGQPILILIIIVLSGFVLSFVQPLNDAVYSELLDRLGQERSHLLGISRANSSIAYILSPILVGFMADKVGYSATFAVVALIAAIVGIITLIFSPRKIKLPQGQLKEISDELKY